MALPVFISRVNVSLTKLVLEIRIVGIGKRLMHPETVQVFLIARLMAV